MPAAFIGPRQPDERAGDQPLHPGVARPSARAVPRPRAILVVSAHWYINATAVTAMPRPRTIHDFYGFPPRAVRRPVPRARAPELAAEISRRSSTRRGSGADIDSWGIDHGTWSVLVHAFPDADIPVVQLAINADEDRSTTTSDSARSWRRCASAACWSSASGNVVHNLRGMSWDLADAGYDWARRFDEDAKARMLDDPVAVAALDAHRDFANAGADPDHFLPLLLPGRLWPARAEIGRATSWSTGTPTARCR